MTCNHYCNEPLRCPTCVRRFWRWAEQRTNSKPRKGRGMGLNFYEHVNVISRPMFRPDPRDEKEVCAALREVEREDELVTMTAEQFERWMTTGHVP